MPNMRRLRDEGYAASVAVTTMQHSMRFEGSVDLMDWINELTFIGLIG